MDDLPQLALSVRQPWAWAIIHAGKDIENRSWNGANPGLKFRGTVCIHASTGMTRDEFDDAIESIDGAATNVDRLPQAREMVRGAIIGVVDVVDVVRKSSSPWWCGPVGLVLANPRAIEPIPSKGQLGFFKWQRHGEIAQPMKWMLPVERPSNAYRPSNGTEGDIFWSNWCARCIKNSGCSIWGGAMAGKSPKQWVRDPDPKCTSFQDRRRETNYHCRQTGDLFK